MTAYQDRICAALEDLLRSRAEWDEAPDLHFMYIQDGCMRLSDEEALMPSAIWAGDVPPTYKLAALAGSFASALPPGLLAAAVPEAFEALVAVVFRCEMWSVEVPESASGPARKYATALHAERNLHEHPDRVETRMAWAVTRERRHWTASMERASGRVRSGRAPVVKGLVPESLARIMGAITAGVN